MPCCLRHSRQLAAAAPHAHRLAQSRLPRRRAAAGVPQRAPLPMVPLLHLARMALLGAAARMAPLLAEWLPTAWPATLSGCCAEATTPAAAAGRAAGP